MEGAAQLLLELHGRILRLLAKETGSHFEGLAVASRHISRSSTRRDKVFKKWLRDLANLDGVSAWVRHITVPKSEEFAQASMGFLAQIAADGFVAESMAGPTAGQEDPETEQPSGGQLVTSPPQPGSSELRAEPPQMQQSAAVSHKAVALRQTRSPTRRANRSSCSGWTSSPEPT